MYFIIEDRTLRNGSVEVHVHAEQVNEYLAIHTLNLFVLTAMEQLPNFKYMLHMEEIDASEFYGGNEASWVSQRFRIVKYDCIKSAIECKPAWQKNATFNETLNFDFGNDVDAALLQRNVRIMLKSAHDWSDLQTLNSIDSSDGSFCLNQVGFEAHLDLIFVSSALEL